VIDQVLARTDYAALVDTFGSLPAHPKIAVCHPPPAFSNASLASDSVITGSILPMIDSVRVMTGASLIDFNSRLRNQGILFPDGIHPSIEGSRLMASIVYEGLTGCRIRRASDPDLAAGRPVTASGYEKSARGPERRRLLHEMVRSGAGLGRDRPGRGQTIGLFRRISVRTALRDSLRFNFIDSSEWRALVDRGADRTQPHWSGSIGSPWIPGTSVALYYAAMGDKNRSSASAVSVADLPQRLRRALRGGRTAPAHQVRGFRDAVVDSGSSRIYRTGRIRRDQSARRV
jgi:hypothetical protein